MLSTRALDKLSFGNGKIGATFCVVYIIGSEVKTAELYSSEGDGADVKLGFRPVVTLNSNVVIKSGEGTQSSAYEIGL